MGSHALRSTLLLLLAVICAVRAYYPQQSDKQEPLSLIAFGSCNKQYKTNKFWKPLQDMRPDLWVWLGDAVYLDTYFALPVFRYPSPKADMVSGWQQQMQIADYVAFDKSTPMIGVWDDHDRNCNDCGADYSGSLVAQEMFADFLHEPADSPMRKRKGTYSAHSFGPSGKRVKFILLDIRSFATKPSPSGDILGPEQWQWLEHEVSNNDAQITFIGSGVQLVSTNKFMAEGWKNFPTSRRRLFELLAKDMDRRDPAARSAYIVLTGDVHYTEVDKLHMCTWKADGSIRHAYPIYDVTSSGLTHAWPSRLGAWYESIFSVRRVGDNKAFFDKNVGLIRIDWDVSPVVVHIDTVNEAIESVVNITLPITHLTTPIHQQQPQAQTLFGSSSIHPQLLDTSTVQEDCDKVARLHYSTSGYYIQAVQLVQGIIMVVLLVSTIIAVETCRSVLGLCRRAKTKTS